MDAVWCLAVQPSCCIRRTSPINIIWDIQLDKHFASVWTATWKTVKEYEKVPKGESPQQPFISCSVCYTNTSHWCPDFFPFAVPPTPLKLNTTRFSLKSKIPSVAFWIFAFFCFCFLSSWQTISVHGWSFKASTLFEFQGKWKNNVKAWRTVASGIRFSFTFYKSNGAYHPELWETH